MKRAALLALCLAGCVQSLPVGAERPPRASDIEVVDAVRDAWIAAGNPYTSRCRAERADRLVVVRADQDVMRNGTGYCASRGPCCGSPERQASCGCQWAQGAMGCAAGATMHVADWIQPVAGLAQHWRVTMYVSAFEDEQTQRRIVAHEYTHSLGACALGDKDRLHARAGWWGAGGVESAAW